MGIQMAPCRRGLLLYLAAVHDDLDIHPRHGQDSMTGTLWRDMPACRDQNVPVVAVHQREGGPDRSAWITHRFLLRFPGEPA